MVKKVGNYRNFGQEGQGGKKYQGYKFLTTGEY